MTPTPEQVEAWAREAGFAGMTQEGDVIKFGAGVVVPRALLERFAALACDWQRESDAQICDGYGGKSSETPDTAAYGYLAGAEMCAEAIRSDCAEP